MAIPWPLADLTAEDQAMLADVAQVVALAPGEALVTSGEHPDALLLVQEGEARVEVGGREIARVGPGSLVGEMSFASGDPAMATVVAVGAVRVARVSTADVAACATRRAGFSGRLYRAIARVVVERLHRRRSALFEENAGDAELPVFADAFAAVRDATLPPVAAAAIERYERVGDPHRTFLHRWAWHGLGATRLSVVPEPWSEHVQTTKLLMVVVNVLLRDLAGVPGRERELHAAIDRLMAVDRPDDRADLDTPSCDLLLALWGEIEDRARELPGWERHRLLWRFDCGQVLAALRYVVLTRTHPGLDNLAEHGAYLPHSESIMAFATLDLMAAPDADEIALVREVAWHAQAVAQVANMVVAWRREVADRDFGSRVFGLALDRGALTRAELETLTAEEIVERIERAGVEQMLLDELRSHRSRVAEVAARSSAIDLRAYERALEEVLAMELAARGLL